MPILELTYPTDALGPDMALEPLAQKLTRIVLRAEKAPDTERAKSMTLVYCHEVPPSRTFIAGVRASSPTLVLRVTMPHGAISPRRRQLLIAEATDAIAQAARTAGTGLESTRIIVVISEVSDGYLGLDGWPVSLPELARMAAGPGPLSPSRHPGRAS